MEKFAYTYEEAAAACGVSIDTIRRKVRTGDLVPRYLTARPVIPADELQEWVMAAPTEPSKAAS